MAVSSAMSWSDAVAAANGRVIDRPPSFTDEPSAAQLSGTWPLKTVNPKASSIAHVVDVVRGVAMTDEIKKEVVEKYSQGKLTELPPPFGPGTLKPGTSFKMQLLVWSPPASVGSSEDAAPLLIKHYTFDKSKMTGKAARLVAVGEAFVIDWQGVTTRGNIGRTAFQLMIRAMGGFQCTCYDVEEEMPLGDAGKGAMGPEDVDAGIDYINLHAPRDAAQNAQLPWSLKNVNDKSSPIYKWQRGIIREAIHNLAQDNGQSTTQLRHPVTLFGLAAWFRHAFAPLLSTLSSKSVIFVGEPRQGKTPVLYALCMALSRYWIARDGVDREPSFRSTVDLDSLRRIQEISIARTWWTTVTCRSRA